MMWYNVHVCGKKGHISTMKNIQELNIRDYTNIINPTFKAPIYDIPSKANLKRKIARYYISINKKLIMKIMKKYPIECILFFGATKELFDMYTVDELTNKYHQFLYHLYGTMDPLVVLRDSNDSAHEGDLKLKLYLMRFEKLFNRYMNFPDRYIGFKIGEIILNDFMDKATDKHFKPIDASMYMMHFVKDGCKGIKLFPSYMAQKNLPVLNKFKDCNNIFQAFRSLKDKRAYATDHLTCNVINGKREHILNLIELEISKQKICDSSEKKLAVTSLQKCNLLSWYLDKDVAVARVCISNCVVCTDKNGYSRMYLYYGNITTEKLIGIFDKSTPYSIYHDMRINDYTITNISRIHDLDKVYPIKINSSISKISKLVLESLQEKLLVSDFSDKMHVDLYEIVKRDKSTIYEDMIYKIISIIQTYYRDAIAYDASYPLDKYGLNDCILNVSINPNIDHTYGNRSQPYYLSHYMNESIVDVNNEERVLTFSFVLSVTIEVNMHDIDMLWKNIMIFISSKVTKNRVVDITINSVNNNINAHLEYPYDWNFNTNLNTDVIDVFRRRCLSIYKDELSDSIYKDLRTFIMNHVSPLMIDPIWQIYYFVMNCYSLYEELCSKKKDQFRKIYFSDNIYNFIAQYHYFNRDGIDSDDSSNTMSNFSEDSGPVTIHSKYICSVKDRRHVLTTNDPNDERVKVLAAATEEAPNQSTR